MPSNTNMGQTHPTLEIVARRLQDCAPDARVAVVAEASEATYADILRNGIDPGEIYSYRSTLHYTDMRAPSEQDVRIWLDFVRYLQTRRLARVVRRAL